MGQVAEFLSFTRDQDGGLHMSSVQVDLSGGANVTAEHYADAGDDSQPLDGDFVALEDSAGAGARQVAGYLDPYTEKKAGPGEKRTYARSARGVVACEIWQKADGTVVVESFASAKIELRTQGQVIVHSPDVRLGRGAGRKVACVGDLVSGAVLALSAAPGQPIKPVPPALPTPSQGVPFVGQIISGALDTSAS